MNLFQPFSEAPAFVFHSKRRPGLLGWFIAGVMFGLLVAGGTIATNTDHVRDWQVQEDINRREAHAIAQKEFVDDYVVGIIASVEKSYKHVRDDIYPSCIVTNTDPTTRYCLSAVARVFGHISWLHHEFGIEGNYPVDSVYTDSQKAIILDWESYKASNLKDPLYLASLYHDAKKRFENPPSHPVYSNVHLAGDRRYPTFPLRSEYPGPTEATLANNNGRITITPNLAPTKELWAYISAAPSDNLSIAPVTLTWPAGNASPKTSQITDMKTPDTARDITVTVKFRYGDDLGTVIFTETLDITI